MLDSDFRIDIIFDFSSFSSFLFFCLSRVSRTGENLGLWWAEVLARSEDRALRVARDNGYIP